MTDPAMREREAVVAWLRRESQRNHELAVEAARNGDNDYCAIYVHSSAASTLAADAIQRGDHHKEAP